MNKYLVTIGEIGLERISESYIVYSNDSESELENNTKFLNLVDEVIYDLYYDYGEEGEDWESFQEDMGIIRIEKWKDEYESYTNEILYDE